jgi:integral membrane sensor domain MASE1
MAAIAAASVGGGMNIDDRAGHPGTARRRTHWIGLAGGLVALCLAYALGGLIGKSLRFPSSNLSLLWPPTAIVMATLLVTPARRWWMYLLAVTPAHFALQLTDGDPVLGILSQLLGNLGQALLAATAIRVTSH